MGTPWEKKPNNIYSTSKYYNHASILSYYFNIVNDSLSPFFFLVQVNLCRYSYCSLDNYPDNVVSKGLFTVFPKIMAMLSLSSWWNVRKEK